MENMHKTLSNIFAIEKKLIFSKSQIAGYKSVSKRTIKRRVDEGKLPEIRFKHTDKEYPKFLISDIVDINVVDEDLVSLIEDVVFKEMKKQYFTSEDLSRLLSISIQTMTRINTHGKFIQSKSENSINAKKTYKLYDVVNYLVECRQYLV